MMEEIKENREGQHPSVTDLIDCLTKTYYDSEPSNHLEINNKTKLYFLIGLGLERSLLVSRKKLPIYGVTEGIHWHVDSLDEGLLELKSTRISPKNAPDNFSQRWMKQVKSYLVANGLKECDLAVIYLVQPEFVVWHLAFDSMELDIHWEWMKRRRDVWNEAKTTRVPPKAYEWNAEGGPNSWDCKECSYKIICELNKGMGK